MERTSTIILMAVSVVCASSHLCVANDLEDLEKRIADTWRNHKSMTATFKRVVEQRRADGTVKTISRGTLQQAVVDNTIMSRLDTAEYEITTVSGSETAKAVEKRVWIDDGQHTFSYTVGTDKAAQWVNCGGDDPRERLESLRRRYELKVLPSADSAAEPTLVVEAVAKDATQTGTDARILLTYRPDGILLKEVRYDKDGNTSSAIELSKIELDIDINSSRFVLKLPGGTPLKVLHKGQGLPVKKRRE